MSTLFADGHIIDLVLAFTLVEAILIASYHRRTGLGLAPGDLMGTLLSGICLMLTVRCVLLGATWYWVGFWLFAALLAHLYDLRRRWRRQL